MLKLKKFKGFIAGIFLFTVILISPVARCEYDFVPEDRENYLVEKTYPDAVKPYPILVYYHCNLSATSGNTGSSDPFFKVYINGTLVVHHEGQGIDQSGTFEIPANTKATVQLKAGAAHNWTGAHWGFPADYSVTYYHDITPPNIPNQPWVKQPNQPNQNQYSPQTGKFFVNYSPITLNWDNTTDNGTPMAIGNYGPYTYGPSAIRYNAYVDETAGTSWVTGQECSLSLSQEGHPYIIHLKAKDYDNNICNGFSPPCIVIVDQTPPTGNITINNHSQSTNAPNVIVSLSNISDGANGSGVTQVGFSSDNETYDWYPYTESITTKNWTLSPGDGPKNVYLKLRDALGNETTHENAVPATIILDTTPPSGSFTINDGVGLTTSQLVMLTLEASDELSGVAKMQFSNNGTDFSTAEEYKPNKYWTLSDGEGAKTVYIKLTDTLGNTTTQAITDSIYFDQNPVYSGFTPTRTLQADEEWTGDYPIFGQVIVPAGKTLTIRQNVTVTVDGPTDCDPYQNGLIVAGTLIIETGVTVTTVQSGWMGIIVSGTATVTGAYINLAERGLAILENAAVTVNGCTFGQNFAGIHAYASHPAIANCTFRNNIYGIKEDEGGRPTVTDCAFTGNEIPYYHETLTRITTGQLNQIPGNRGNYE
jgi:hypothetical protein